MNRRLLVITLSFLLGLDSIILMEHLGIHIPLVRQFFGFIALTFLPGWIILKISRFTTEGFSEMVFFSAALSISVVMFAEIFANFMFPFFGFDKPITLSSVLITFNIIVLALLIIRHRQVMPAREYRAFNFMRITKWDLFFFLLPLFSLIGAYRFSFCEDNRGVIILYFLISLTPLIFVRVRNFNRTFAIWSIAISLMWSTVFGMSWNYIWGYDINGEYYYANLVLSRGIWNISVYYQYNTVASVNILAPVYSLILNIPLVPIFKVVYSLLFSLVPVILLKAYERLLEKRVWTELSVLFFMFLSTFFTEMMALARQMIAELYLALLVYALLKRMHPPLLLIFGMSLIVSHYGTTYLFMFALLFVVLVSLIKNNPTITGRYVVVFWIFTLLWYQYVGKGIQFRNLVDIGYSTIIMLKDILNPQYSQGLAIIVSKTTLVKQIAKGLNLIAQGLISIGVIATVYNIIGQKNKRYIEFYVLSFVFFAYDVAGVIVPFFANRLNATRLYQITLFFLSPYLVIGTIAIYRIFHRVISKIRNLNLKHGTKALAVFLLAYFLFNSGIMLVLLNDPKPPMWLEKTIGPYWSSGEIFGGNWIATHRHDNLKIYSDVNYALIFLGLVGQPISEVSFRGSLNRDLIYNFPRKNAYVYFGSAEVVKKEIPVLVWVGALPKMRHVSIYNPSIFKSLMNSQKIYSSDDVWIYKV